MHETCSKQKYDKPLIVDQFYVRNIVSLSVDYANNNSKGINISTYCNVRLFAVAFDSSACKLLFSKLLIQLIKSHSFALNYRLHFAYFLFFHSIKVISFVHFHIMHELSRLLHFCFLFRSFHSCLGCFFEIFFVRNLCSFFVNFCFTCTCMMYSSIQNCFPPSSI